jgi:hypothetical protein
MVVVGPHGQTELSFAIDLAHKVPEGDGITMRCEREQDPEVVVQDIKECFGFDVKRKI